MKVSISFCYSSLSLGAIDIIDVDNEIAGCYYDVSAWLWYIEGLIWCVIQIVGTRRLPGENVEIVMRVSW